MFGLTLQGVHALVVQVVCVASCVVEIPRSIEVVDFRSPNAAAAIGSGVLVDDLRCCGLQALDGGGTRKLEVGPLSRDQVVVAIKPRDLWVTLLGVSACYGR